MKIFRKIRLNNINTKDFKKYFIYATGEIILVVIGILIALYISNKKEDFDKIEKQNNHLVLIKEELQKNLTTLEEEEKVLTELIENIKGLSNLIYSKKSLDTINESYLSNLLFLPVTRSIEIDYENVAYKELISANTLKDLKNDSVRTILRSWDRNIETLKLQENVVRESLTKMVNFLETNGSLKTILDDNYVSEDYLDIKNTANNPTNKHLIKSKQFENILLQYLGVATQLSKRNYPRFKIYIKRLIYFIEEHLKEDN